MFLMTPGLAGSGWSTRTAKRRVTVAPPPAIEPSSRVQVDGGALVGQLQPVELSAASKVVFGGMVSVRVTDGEVRLPVFWTVSA